ncbi:hypothetical protein A1S_3556 [Acinetobacter baumannii ATCC 17978]|nr:hypothetical protein A1S_3556 [Acinetobacter baumannii ATCC 17978]
MLHGFYFYVYQLNNIDHADLSIPVLKITISFQILHQSKMDALVEERVSLFEVS